MLHTSSARPLSALCAGFIAATLTLTPEAAAQRQLASADTAYTAIAARANARAADMARAARASRAINLWTGQVKGDFPGRATVTLERVGIPEDALDPVWPVLTRWEVQSSTDGRSFSAELYGSIRGSNDCMQLKGIITEGWSKGAEVHVDCRRGGKSRSAVMRILPLRASRPR